MQCEIHWARAYNIANLHVECAIKNCEFFEMLWPEIQYVPLKEYPVLDKGYLYVPQKPGLGVEIDWKSLARQ